MIINSNSGDACKILSEDQYLYSQVARCIYGYSKLLLSYSGGLDSTVLLDILTNLIRYSNPRIKLHRPICLRAVYVDHGLHVNSIHWSNHCANQCKMRSIPFNVVYVNCYDFLKKSCNIEEIARSLRYRKLCDFLNSKEILLTAHHMDDQVETVLLALKRGSGPTGLSGIHKSMILFNSYTLLRPLLKCSKIQLQAYACRKKLTWIEDHTNNNIDFDRNFLRVKVIPLLKERWPAFNTVVQRTAQLCRNQENLLKELLLESLNKLIDSDGALFYYPLLKYSFIKRQVILRYWLGSFSMKMPSYQLLNRIWNEVILSKHDANPILYLGKHICRRFHKKLYILPVDMASTVHALSLSWDISNNSMLLPYNLGLLISQKLTINIDEYFSQIDVKTLTDLHVKSDIAFNYFKTSGKILTNCFVLLPETNDEILIRFGNVSGLLRIVNRKHGRKLKKIWQELCIPPWLRNRIPLLFYNNTLISAIGVFITQDGQIKKTTTNLHNQYITVWRIVWIQSVSYYTFFKNTIRYFLR